MVYTGEDYRNILNGDHRFEHQVRLQDSNGAQRRFYDSDIASLKITGGLFSENRFSIGGCFAREIELDFYPSAFVPKRMSVIWVYVRAVSESRVSDWVGIGTFYIDTRETNDLGMMHITGYDSMLKAEKLYIDPGDVGQWPKKMSEVAEDIASKMGVAVDTWPVRDYDVQLPTGYTMREVLSYIAVASSGNWIIRSSGDLALIPLYGTGDHATVGRNVADFKKGAEQSGWTHVIVNTGDDTYVEAGTDDGETFEVFCPWGTTEMAENILDALEGYVYQPYEAHGAILDPAYEIGDNVSVNGIDGILASVVTTHDALCAADISAPSDNEIDHEYPYISSLNRQIKRRLQTIETTLYVGPESIVASVKDIDGRITQVSQTADKINWLVASGTDATNFTMTDRAVELVSASINLTGYVQFNDLTKAGSTAINGANITTGKISAERIDVSELHIMNLYDSEWRAVITTSPFGKLYIGSKDSPVSDYDEIFINADEVTIGGWGVYNALVFDVRTNEIYGRNSWDWKLGTSAYGFECLWLHNAIRSVQLTAGVGTLLVNGSEVLTGDLAISAIKSGSYSLTISGSSITPSSTDITLGSSSNYFNQIFTKELKLCYSSTRSLALSCGYSGELLINGDEYVPTKLVYGTYELEISADGVLPSSTSINLGSSSYYFNQTFTKKLTLLYGGSKSIDLECNSSGRLTVGGSELSVSTDKIESGSYNLTISGSSITPSSTSITLGSSSAYFNSFYTKKTVLHYNDYTSVELGCNSSGRLTVGGSELSVSVSKIESGSYSLSISGSDITPSSTSISLGSLSSYLNAVYVKSLYVINGTYTYVGVTCDSYGYLNIGNSLLPKSSGSYSLGSDSNLWNYLHTKTVRVYYNSYTYVDLACNYNGQLTAGGSVVATT